ncbi:hypothetical protein SLE2022_326020 [Rubroshorea leprosula]
MAIVPEGRPKAESEVGSGDREERLGYDLQFYCFTVEVKMSEPRCLCCRDNLGSCNLSSGAILGIWAGSRIVRCIGPEYLGWARLARSFFLGTFGKVSNFARKIYRKSGEECVGEI